MNPLPCLNCQDVFCRYDRDKPPCQQIASDVIASAAIARLTTKVSAAIAVYKPKEENIRRCLSHIIGQVDEIVICADLDSDWDALNKWVSETVKGQVPVQMVRIEERNTGYTAKLNRSVRESNGQFVWALNDDCFAEPDVISKLMAHMDDDPTVGAVCHTLLYPGGGIQFAGLGRPPGHIGFGHLDHKKPVGRFTQAVEQESFCGASVLFRRKAFYAAGASDESLPLYSQDAALGLQMRQAGYRIIFEPSATGIHIEHQSTSQTGDIGDLCKEANEVFVRKWEPYFRHNSDPTKLGTFDYDK